MKTQNILTGALAGIAGGIVFGIMMGVMGMLPMVAKLIGSSSAIVGFLVHLINSALIGGAFGAVLGGKTDTLARGAAWGAGYGIVWWVLGALIIMPMWLGMPPRLHLNAAINALPSLMGHLIYGVITGIVFNRIASRSTQNQLGALSPSRS